MNVSRKTQVDAPVEFLELVVALALDLWPSMVAGAYLGVSGFAAGHVLMRKKEPAAAVGWVGLILLSPLVGSILYWAFGVNRIKRRAVELREQGPHLPQLNDDDTVSVDPAPIGDGQFTGTRRQQVKFGDQAIKRPLLGGNAIKILQNGDEAYPAMLAAIDKAEKSIGMQTYIFDNDDRGKEFVAALGRAVKRGVEVRVLIDSAGSRYSFPSIFGSLRRHNIKAARFNPSLIPWRMSYINLRNHRKNLVIDGKHGFTGGMNVRGGNVNPDKHSSDGIQDLHFYLQGPVVNELSLCFLNDWIFSTRERMPESTWLPNQAPAGDVYCRGIPDGPDRDFEKIHWTFIGAITHAKKTIRIVTPYFLPDTTMIKCLSVAAMSGVEVDIILPEKNNLNFVQWASTTLLPDLIRGNCRIYYSPPPFDHSKILVIDDDWVLVGSSNWDPRSFRLNFEFNVECLDHDFAKDVIKVFDKKKQASRQIGLSEISRRKPLQKLRDGVARLFIPYL